MTALGHNQDLPYLQVQREVLQVDVEEGMAEPGGRSLGAMSLLTAGGLLAAIAIGAWWTGLAVAAGEPGQTVLRFVVSLIGGWYYLVLYRVARGRIALPGPR